MAPAPAPKEKSEDQHDKHQNADDRADNRCSTRGC